MSTAASSASPVSRLYTHALHSVFAFCDVQGLIQLSRVCKEWHGAASSLPSIRGRIHQSHANCVRIDGLIARHISALSMHSDVCLLFNARTALLALTNLDTLSAVYSFAAHSPNVQWPATLRRVLLRLPTDCHEPVPEVKVHALLSTLVCSLPLLEDLSFPILTLSANYRFVALAAAPRLRRLTLNLTRKWVEKLTSEQADDLRALTQLHVLRIEGLTHFASRDLLSAPHALQWQELPVAAHVSSLQFLGSLQQLTKLKVALSTNVLDPLAQLRHLTTLDLAFDGQSAGVNLRTLARCSSVTDLSIAGILSEDDLAAGLAAMTALRRLHLRREPRVHSLRFLAEPANLSATLEELILCHFHLLRATEVRCLDGLKSLQRLDIANSFNDDPLTAELQSLYTPPSAILPALVRFRYNPPARYDDQPPQG